MEPVQRRELPWHEARSKLLKKPISLKEMKEWRTREADAGRPLSFADLCRTFELCVTCLGEGVTRNDRVFLGMDIPGTTHVSYKNDRWLRSGIKLSRLSEFYEVATKLWSERPKAEWKDQI
jgi:hypothetical protein